MTVRLGVLGAWFCFDVRGTEEDAIAYLRENSGCPVSEPALIKDRLYGGFHCGDSPHRRHVYFDLGAYTYLGENSPLDVEDRAARWMEIREANPEWDGEGLFASDGKPVAPR